MKLLKKNMNSELIKNRIQADTNEFQKFGYSGTPVFLINGVTLEGAQPIENFEAVIGRHLSAKK
jgi:protein-disulfide isomerase